MGFLLPVALYFLHSESSSMGAYSIKLPSLNYKTYGLPFLAIGLSKSGGFHLKSGRFHEIRMKSSGFHMKSARNLADFTWNPPDFMKSIWNPVDFTWNLPDFMKSRMWAFGWSPSIGLSFERPKIPSHTRGSLAGNFTHKQFSISEWGSKRNVHVWLCT